MVLFGFFVVVFLSVLVVFFFSVLFFFFFSDSLCGGTRHHESFHSALKVHAIIQTVCEEMKMQEHILISIFNLSKCDIRRSLPIFLYLYIRRVS